MSYSRVAENIAPYGHLEKAGHQVANAKLVFPGVRGKLKKSITTEDGTILPSGATVIIQPLNRDEQDTTPTFLLTPYTNNKNTQRKDQPETHRDIITDKSYTAKLTQPEDYLNFNNEHFRRTHDVLFPTPDSPSLEEIRQSRLPDCFLLSGLQALINHPQGKAFIRGMLHQHDDGTTTVRFYDEAGLPEYFRVENSVIVDGRGELNHHEASWIPIIEKAFAARGKRNLQPTDASISSVYTGGGQTYLALQSLTGLKVEHFHIKSSAFPWEIEAFLSQNARDVITILLGRPEATISQVTNFLSTLSPVQLTAIYDAFGATVGDEAAQLQALNQYVELIKCRDANPVAYDAAVQERSVTALQSAYPQAAALLADIFSKRTAFSGHYGQDQLAIYEAIEKGLAAGKLITAGTPSKFEHKVVGISDNHAYTVLGVLEKQLRVKDKQGQEKTITARFVQLRNPWGDATGTSANTGRMYEQHAKNLDIKIQGGRDASFGVELTEFCQYYHDYDISASANLVFARDVEKEKVMADITHFINNFAIDFTSSNQDLITANQDYQSQITQLVKFELRELDKVDDNLIEAVNAIFNEKYDATIESMTVLGLLDATLFPTISGTVEEVKEHIYHLLKLNWLKQQETLDIVLETELIEAIQQHATVQPELWEELAVTKTMLTMVATSRMNSYRTKIDYMLELGHQLHEDINALRYRLQATCETEPALLSALTQKLINNFINLEQLYHEFLNLDIVMRSFAYSSNNEEHLSHIAEIIEECAVFIEPVREAQPLFQELWKLRDTILLQAADLERRREITSEEADEITEATKCMFAGKLKPTGDKLLASSSPTKRELGEKMIEADTLAKKILRAFSRISAFFTKTAATIGTLFHVQNSYELPAVESASPRSRRSI